MRRVALWAVLWGVLITSGSPGAAVAGPRYEVELGWGAAAVGVNLLYMPAKLAYAAVGGLIGGLAYAVTWGDTDAVQKVWSPSLGGTYVVTPGMLQGESPILFLGESYG